MLSQIKFFVRCGLVLFFLFGFSFVHAQTDDQPQSVTIAGTIQSVLGCPGDWQPECENTSLTYDEISGLWRGQFELPAGDYEYKVAINGSWSENYGGRADPDGPNVRLSLSEDQSVQFIYDHQTHWVADSVNSIIANVPGSFQSELGCPTSMGAGGDWAPACLITWLQDPDGDGIYIYVAEGLPVGDYEAKVALNESWDVNYGADGARDGANIPFSVTQEGAPVAFLFNTADNILTINTDGSTDTQGLTAGGSGETVVQARPRPLAVDQPDKVVIPGTIQSVLGCEGDWMPDCDITALTYIPEEDIWRGSFDLPAGDYEYKVAINGSWSENYGGAADANGPNVTLSLSKDTTVHFYYDHFTHWVADSVNDAIIVAPGSFQNELGCPTSMGADGDWAPMCLRSWMQDPDGDGIYVFSTTSIPAGDYEVKVALYESWDVNYGDGGTPSGANIPFSVPEDDIQVTFAFNTSDNKLSIGIGEPAVVGRVVRVNLAQAQAYWVTADTIAWDIDDAAEYRLYYSPDATLAVEGAEIVGGEYIRLAAERLGLSDDVLAKFPHLAGLAALHIESEAELALVPQILRGQFAVAAFDEDGMLIGGTSLQIPGVLDHLYTYDGDLGVTWDDEGIPTIRVWAPTAQNVRFYLYADSDENTQPTILEMTRDDATGVWSITGEPDWIYQYYLYEVTVYAPSVGRVVQNLVTDPYSFSLSMNSTRTQIVDLNDPALMPEGWLENTKPLLNAPEDIVVYELHIRDFSMSDPNVPAELKGTFAAFTIPDSFGMQHLNALAQAGLTHIHLLPSFDIATINENPDERVEPDFDLLASFPPDSDQQTELINPIRDQDGFNWGYDPLHYTVPEGSYSTNPDGAQRVIEFRQMVMALNQAGLRVVMDVVYNHTNASGQNDRSVLDRIVPGYYHRLNANGTVETSTCCQNTATEHNMMRKLMIDSIVTWATAYQVDGFRFDLMGHHMLDDMLAVREALDALTLETNGVDGESIYVYGEGWNFGEVANNARGVNATQLNVAGTGIGSFNDRLRDAARGGTPFEGQQHQGFINGLYTNPNGVTPGDENEQLTRLLRFSDWVRIGLAGNLANYTFVNADGEVVSGAEVDYNGSPAGYTLDPQENIIYVAAHDNETLWDAIQYKAPESADIETRVRMNNLGLSIVGFSQGVPFFHAGDDMLRSKSLDRDSYNSSDWFNRLDFTYQTNNWGVGLPPSSRENWDIIQPLLANPDLQVTSENILDSVMHMREVLQIRRSSPLFRLQTEADVLDRLNFYNTGADQIPGLIVMGLSDQVDGLPQIDPNYQMIVVVFNARNEAVEFQHDALMNMSFELHPVQTTSNDPIVQTATYENGVFNVPAYTTAVFVVPR